MTSLLSAWRQNSKHRKAENELARLSDRELTDLGIFRADIPSVVRGNRRPN
ncbi:MAG: DUF1127 domain-containing protein [Alphaproteobacteria bacterium]|nr:DUF1127 domain-containing protein [Alphaproteobacteria bacterium]